MNKLTLVMLVAAGLYVMNFATAINPAIGANEVMVVHITSALRYEPKTVTIYQGQTVMWKNMTAESHTVTDDPLKARDPNDAALPAGAVPFDSGEITGGQTFSKMFVIPGTYKYFCKYVEHKGMVGTVIVKQTGQ